MIKISGKAINSKTVLGKAVIIKQKKIKIDKKKINKDEVAKELKLFKNIFQKAIDEIDYLIENYARTKIDNEVLTSHKLILKDPEVLETIEFYITNKLYSFEYTVEHYFSKNIQLFKNMENEYFAQRAWDFEDIKNKLLVLTKGDSSLNISSKIKEGSIIISQNITPSEIIKYYKKNIGGICLQKGSTNSHSIIMAKSLGLQCFIGIENIFEKVNEDDYIILDGVNKRVIIKPKADTITNFRNIIVDQEIKNRRLEKYIDKNAFTKDGTRIKINNNLEFPEEIEYIKHNKIDGIGLFRTEFLFIEKQNLPSEDEQFEQYKKIVEAFKPTPVIFRTIDVGGDKLVDSLNMVKETNPNLGCRGIRLSLRNVELFKKQIRALLRASAFGNLNIMFPMISSIEEVRETKKIINECKKELDNNSIQYSNDIKIGIMIEIPAAVFISKWLAEEVEFFSLGTNDLVQYNLAVDRNSENVEEYYQPFMPSNIQAIKYVIDNALKTGIDISICGDAASDINFIKILLGLGMRNFSIIPSNTLLIKDKLSKLTIEDCENYVKKILKVKTKNEIINILNEK